MFPISPHLNVIRRFISIFSGKMFTFVVYFRIIHIPGWSDSAPGKIDINVSLVTYDANVNVMMAEWMEIQRYIHSTKPKTHSQMNRTTIAQTYSIHRQNIPRSGCSLSPNYPSPCNINISVSLEAVNVGEGSGMASLAPGCFIRILIQTTFMFYYYHHPQNPFIHASN